MNLERKTEVPKVKDILSNHIIAFNADYTIYDAIGAFNKYSISSAPVIDHHNVAIGYLYECDCLSMISSTLYFDESIEQSIHLIMKQEIETVSEDWDIFELEFFLNTRYLRSAPVRNRDNYLVGIVNQSDMLLALLKCIHGRDHYKNSIKNPLELSSRERIKMIVERYEKKGAI